MAKPLSGRGLGWAGLGWAGTWPLLAVKVPTVTACSCRTQLVLTSCNVLVLKPAGLMTASRASTSEREILPCLYVPA